MRVDNEEHCTHAELEVVKHPLAVVRRVEENNSDEESTAEVMNELDPKYKLVTEDLCHHHLKEN